MATFRKLVVPVDFSDFSRAALKYTVELVKGTEAEILLLHVLEPMMPGTAYIPTGGHATPYPELVEAARQGLAELEPLAAGVRCKSLVRTGEPGAEIVTCAKEEGADVIVLCTHGRSGLARLVLGSTAEAVIRQAPVPVLTLRAHSLIPS
jgi:nucleotide-binding universal stress UspA family protein